MVLRGWRHTKVVKMLPNCFVRHKTLKSNRGDVLALKTGATHYHAQFGPSDEDRAVLLCNVP